MKRAFLFLTCPVVGFLFAVLLAGTAYSDTIEDPKLAQYGQYGGPFNLIDHHGIAVNDRDFLGQYILIFFGYTYCPDVCPATMQTVGEVLDILGEKEKIQALFVTLDPKRDTPEVLAGFVSHFHPRMTGLSGAKEQTLSIANDFGVTFFKMFYPPSISAEDTEDNADEDSDDSYLINHSAATYLMGPDGRFITLFPFGTLPEEMAMGVRKVLESATK